jgi:PBSX family phage terminase large subunit
MSTIVFPYRPIPVHADFHRSTSYERFLFGAFGSGKTWAVCAEAIAWCLEQPGIRGLVTRRTVPELRDTTETVFFEILPTELYQAGEVRRTGGHVESFTFPNGSKVLFRAIDDWNKHKSLNIGFIAWDEVDEFDEETYMGMSSRVRQKEPTPEGRDLGAGNIRRRGMWAASNPGGHNWVWRRAVNSATKVKGVAYWKSTSFDNPYLPPEYTEGMVTNYPAQWVRRYVLCQFDDFAGQIYESWNWDDHVFKEELKIDGRHAFWMGMDPGTRNPTAGLWVVVDKEGDLTGRKRSLVGIAEYSQNYEAAQQHAAAWRQIEAQHKMRVSWRVSDPNALPVKDRGTNMGLDDQYRRLGFNFVLGPSKHRDRIPMLGSLIATGRFMVTPNCPMTYEAIKNYQWEELTAAMRAKGVDAPDKPLKKGDHLVDCAQYLSSRFVAPVFQPTEKPPQDAKEELVQAVKRDLKKKRDGLLRKNHSDGVIV